MKKALTDAVKAHAKLLQVGRLYVGAGASGVEAARIAREVGWKPKEGQQDCNIPELILGGPDIWEKMMVGNANWRLGQSGNLVTPTSSHSETEPPRLLVTDYLQQQQQKLKDLDIAQQTDIVTKITMHSHNEFLIELESGKQFLANEVVLSNGAGPSKELDPQIPVVNKPEEQRRPFPEMASGEHFLFHGRPGKEEYIAVVGDGATSAWVVEKCLMHGVRPEQLIWIGQDQNSAFSRASTAINSSMARNATKDIQMVADIQGITYRDLKNHNDLSEPGIELSLTGAKPKSSQEEKGKDVSFYVSRIIFATGPNELGHGSALDLLSEDVRQTLRPIPDMMGHFAPTSTEECVTGMISKEGNLYILGSPTPGALRATLHPTVLYDAVTATLPKAAQANVGITTTNATIAASIETLNNRFSFEMVNKKLINFDTDNRPHIAKYLRDNGIDQLTAIQIADEIITKRAEYAHGLPLSELTKIVGERLATKAVETHEERSASIKSKGPNTSRR